MSVRKKSFCANTVTAKVKKVPRSVKKTSIDTAFTQKRLESYFQPKTAVESKVKPLKPFLFLPPPGGTGGDNKPLAIMAVLAARTAILPVTMVLWREMEHAFSFLHKYCPYFLGENWTQKLKILYLDELDLQAFYKDAYEKHTYTVFWVAGIPDLHVETNKGKPFALKRDPIELASFHDQGPFFDFGDTRGTRLASNLLHYQKKHKDVFGALYLPVEKTDPWWSKDSVVHKLQAFRKFNVHKKILVLGGSLRVPFYLNYITEWFWASGDETEPDKNAKTPLATQQQDWVIVLLQYKTQHMFYKELPEAERTESLAKIEQLIQQNRCLWLQEYVEFEDVLRITDFFVSNCGAGSVMTCFAAGCPQTCRYANDHRQPRIIGNDKRRNASDLDGLGLGPYILEGEEIRAPSGFEDEKPRPSLFQEFMQNISDYYDEYNTNAKLAQEVIRQEYAMLLVNLETIFYEGSYQKDFFKIPEGLGFPSRFKLPPPPPPMEKEDDGDQKVYGTTPFAVFEETWDAEFKKRYPNSPVLRHRAQKDAWHKLSKSEKAVYMESAILEEDVDKSLHPLLF